MEIENLSSQRLHLHVIKRGSPTRPTVILLHGGLDQARSWDQFASAIEAEFRLVTPDMRGHGRSDWVTDGNYQVTDNLVDLHALVTALDVDQVALIGHSMGGNAAVRYAGLYPEKIWALVAIEGLTPAPKPGVVENDPLDQLRTWIERRTGVQRRTLRSYADIQAAKARIAEKNPSLSHAMVEHLARHGTRRQDDGTLVFQFDPLLTFDEPADLTYADKQRLWASITAPTLLVYGGDSWAVSPEVDGRAACFRSAQTVVVPDAGHWVHLDQPERFAQIAAPFLRNAASRLTDPERRAFCKA